MNLVENTGGMAPEPDWDGLFDDELELAAAREHWRRVTLELRDRQLLAATNGHALQRLIVAYVLYDRCLRTVATAGIVTKPKRGNSRAIARTSPYFTAMREMASDAAVLEQELGISPRRRSGATKAQNGKKAPRPADTYLKPVG